jgi:LysM repeat protein
MKRLKEETKSISFKGAFVIVIALHVAVVLAVMVFSNIKKNTKELLAKQKIKTQDQEFIQKETRSEWPQSFQKPKVVATIPSTKKREQTTTNPSPIIIPLKPSKPTSPSVPVIAKATPKPTPKPTHKTPSTKQTAIASTSAVQKSITNSLSKWQALASSNTIPKNAQTFAKSKIESELTAEFVDTPPNQVQTSQKTYVLTSGDNLYMVSKKLNVSFNELVKANNIRDVRDLYAGLTLKVPQ